MSTVTPLAITLVVSLPGPGFTSSGNEDMRACVSVREVTTVIVVRLGYTLSTENDTAGFMPVHLIGTNL